MSPTPTKPSKAGRNLPAAILVGLGLIAAIALGLFVWNWFFVAMTAVALSLGVKEVHGALLRKGMHPELWPVVIGTVVAIVGAYLAADLELGIAPTTFLVICLSGTMVATLAMRLRGGVDGYLRDVAATALLIAYIPMMGVFVALLMGATMGPLRIVAIIVCVVLGDTGAYAVGVTMGKHKMAPSISPSKTWEGFTGALIFAAVGGVVVLPLVLKAPWWLGLIFGLACALAAVLGDLVESLIKRDAGLKDMSNLLPGHGGIMDRLDSMLVAFPVGWLVLHVGLGA